MYHCITGKHIVISYMVWDIILILLFLVLVLLIRVLFVPVILSIDTESDTYLVRIRGLVSFRMAGENEELIFILKGPFFKKILYPFRENKSKADLQSRRKKRSKRKTGIRA